MTNWPEKIKLLRQKALITQGELAALINVAFVSVNRWENGHCEPTMSAKRDLVKLFKKYDIKWRIKE